MKRPDPGGQRLWSIVAATVRPIPGRVVPEAESARAASPATLAGPAQPQSRGRRPPPPAGVRPAGPAAENAPEVWLAYFGLAPTPDAGAPTAAPETKHAAPSPPRPRTQRPRPPDPIEPNRHRRLIRSDPGDAAIIDLHGLGQDRARAALTAFILSAQAGGARAILVITGKGAQGDGVLRRRAPEWLAEPPLRAVVAGLSEAHRKHGGEGAIYVALKRRRPDI